MYALLLSLAVVAAWWQGVAALGVEYVLLVTPHLRAVWFAVVCLCG